MFALSTHRKLVGGASLLGGAGLVLFGLMALLVSGLGTFVTSRVTDPGAREMAQMQAALWSVWRIHAPLWGLTGVGLLLAGISLLRNRFSGAVAALVLALVPFGTLPLYVFHLKRDVLPVWEPMFSKHPGIQAIGWDAYVRLTLIGSSVAVAIPMTAFLVLTVTLAVRMRRAGPNELPTASPPASRSV